MMNKIMKALDAFFERIYGSTFELFLGLFAIATVGLVWMWFMVKLILRVMGSV